MFQWSLANHSPSSVYDPIVSIAYTPLLIISLLTALVFNKISRMHTTFWRNPSRTYGAINDGTWTFKARLLDSILPNGSPCGIPDQLKEGKHPHLILAIRKGPVDLPIPLSQWRMKRDWSPGDLPSMAKKGLEGVRLGIRWEDILEMALACYGWAILGAGMWRGWSQAI